MFDDFEGYAVYWVPRRSDPLAAFGAAWTGWCAESGDAQPRGDFAELGVDVAAVTRELHCHGLHGVIRPPFRLAPGRSRFSVEHVLDALAESLVAFRLPPLQLTVMEGRVALVPAQSCGPLAALVTRVTDALAPLVARPAAVNGFAEARASAGLPAGDTMAFRAAGQRFHVPLSDPMPVERARTLKAALAPLVAPKLGAPRRLGELALMGDPGGGRPLRVLQRYALRDWPLRRGAEALPSHGPVVLEPMPAAWGRADATG